LPQFYGIHKTPQWIGWIENGFGFFDLISISLLVLFFSLNLFQRFRFMRDKITQQALEKEVERGQLIEQQKIILEKTVEERTAELNNPCRFGATNHNSSNLEKWLPSEN
jgi:phage regulator Rha-like protein